MRTFTSYGAVNAKIHYYAPREQLIDRAYQTLLGQDRDAGGHYVTTWAPRQTGKTWAMQQVASRIREEGEFAIAITTLQSTRSADTPQRVLNVLVENLRSMYGIDFPDIERWDELRTFFTSKYFDKPAILILDEFDSLQPNFISALANEFRSIYIERQNEPHLPSHEKKYLLHGLALIGVRSVLGIENRRGSPFNVQRSLHIPNLTYDEVDSMFKWYERESGQEVEQRVIDRLFYETQGQPGLVGWLGELLTENYNNRPDQPLVEQNFKRTFMWASRGLASNNISNLISKAEQEEYKEFVLELFETGKKFPFRFHNKAISFLYLNGVIDPEETEEDIYVKFSSPLVQRCLFDHFTYDLFEKTVDKVFDPFEDLSAILTEDSLNIKNLMRRYELYLQQNREWLLKDAPRRQEDLRILEAVYHFNLFMYLYRFLKNQGAEIWPEFPTGNGQMDIFIRYAGKIYGLEVKSFVSQRKYESGLRQAARYGKSLGHSEMWLILFVDGVDEKNRQKYEVCYTDDKTGVLVHPVLVVTGT